MFGLGMGELVVVLVIVLVVFGAGRLPEVMGSLGKGVNQFKRGLKEPPEIDVTPDDESQPKPKPESSASRASRAALDAAVHAAHGDHLGAELGQRERRLHERDEEAVLLAGRSTQSPDGLSVWSSSISRIPEVDDVLRRGAGVDDLAAVLAADHAALDLDAGDGDGRVVDGDARDDEDEPVAVHALELAFTSASWISRGAAASRASRRR
jgi:sec-independent protein translocase protein TatA